MVGWRCLSLRYSVPWPLHLVLTDRALEDYNRVFRFLVTVRRTQLALHDVWAGQVTGLRRLRADARNDLHGRHLQRLRLHATLVVDNLQQYFMADVLGAQWDKLEKR